LRPAVLDQSANIKRVNKRNKERAFVLPATALGFLLLVILIEKDLVGFRKEASWMPDVQDENVDELRRTISIEEQNVA
jgi:hypothetical protein